MSIVKCLVWDLDETLWRGTLLEDGEVTLTDEVRRTVVGLDARGILQSIASRNDPDHARSWLEKLEIADYFVVPQVGWGRKPDAIRAIAKQLEFAEDAIAFIDDQPAERAEVAWALPGVRCYEAGLAAGLLELPEFSPATVTAEGRERRAMYQARVRRDEARTEYRGPNEAFLRSLDLVLRIHEAAEEDIARVEELTLRTSQMNATGVHYPADVLRGLVADPAHRVLVASLTDRFGSHGAVGVVLLETRPETWRLKLMATSCRVVSFGTGTMILRWLVDQAAGAGAHVVADFRATERNRIMEIAYRFAGFARSACERCRVWLAEPSGVQRLHLVATPQEASPTMRVDAPDLAPALESSGRVR